MTDPRKTAADAEWVKERSAIIYEGAGTAAIQSGEMTEELADSLALEEFRKRQGKDGPKKQKGMF